MRKWHLWTALLFAMVLTLMLTACKGDSGGGGTAVLAANAGPDQNVSTGVAVTLNGSGSSSANGESLTYAWSFISKPATSTAALTGATTVNPSFTADKDGSYVVQLIVNDGTEDSADTVTITASTGNSAPVANAGPDQMLLPVRW